MDIASFFASFFIVSLTMMLVLCVIYWHRNMKTLKFFKELLYIVNDKASQDIKAGRPWKWRFEELNKVSYDTVLLKFWLSFKPENFWKDLSFLE